MIQGVPKIASFYWGNSKISFLRYMTLHTFAHLNPDWKIHYYVPRIKDSAMQHSTPENKKQYERVTDYSKYIAKLPNIEIRQVNFDALGIPEEMSDVYKSDILRWKILAEEGGLWSDMDILFHRPMSHLTLYKDFNTRPIIVRYNEGRTTGLPIGFLLSRGNSEEYRKMFVECIRIVNSKHSDYQKFGTEIFSKVIRSVNASTLHKNCVYPFTPNSQLFTIYKNDFKSNWLCDRSIGIHWFGGCNDSFRVELEMSESNHEIFGALTTSLNEYKINTCSIQEQLYALS